MSVFQCPLCKSSGYILLKSMKSIELIDDYREKLKIDVSKYFDNDQFKVVQCIDCQLKSFTNVRCADGEFYSDMQHYSWYYEDDKPEFEYALSKILANRPGSILEIGCGEGSFLTKLINGYQVKGREYSETAVKKLIDLGIELDAPSDTYDFILAFQVLEHVPDTREFLQNCVDKLNDNGYLLLTVPNNNSKYNREIFHCLDYPPHHMSQWTKYTLEFIAALFGLELVDYYEEPLRLVHYRGLIDNRRRQLPLGKLFEGDRGDDFRKIVSSIDRVLAPYFYDYIHYPGHTHGVLLKKGRL